MSYAPLQVRAAAELELRRRRASGVVGLRAFVSTVNPYYQWYTHCEKLAGVLEGVVSGHVKRLMVFMPPRHGKSELISRLFSAYYLYRNPAHWVGVNSYAADLAYTFSRAARDNYTRMGGAIRGDAAAVKHWQTPQGGGLWAAGVGGPITGKGFHLGIIDDPLKNAEEAQSEVVRAKQREWYASTFYTRQEPDAAIVIVQTRWHEEDLSGGLLMSEGEEPEGWTIVNLPAVAEADPQPFPKTCTTLPDWRDVGAALCPERYPLDRLHKIEARIGAYFYSALFQQRPRPKGGNQFKREWFEVVNAAPAHAERVRYWDKAGADTGKGDYTAGVLMARDRNGIFYIEDVERFQLTAAARNARIVQTAAMDGDSVTIYVEQPPGLAKESTDAVVRLLAGYAVYADKVTKDKVSRAEPFQAQAQAGNVKVVKGKWNKAWFDELEAFPNGKHDDQVDASSGAFNRLADIPAITVHRPATVTNRWRQL